MKAVALLLLGAAGFWLSLHLQDAGLAIAAIVVLTAGTLLVFSGVRSSGE